MSASAAQGGHKKKRNHRTKI